MEPKTEQDQCFESRLPLRSEDNNTLIWVINSNYSAQTETCLRIIYHLD